MLTFPSEMILEIGSKDDYYDDAGGGEEAATAVLPEIDEETQPSVGAMVPYRPVTQPAYIPVDPVTGIPLVYYHQMPGASLLPFGPMTTKPKKPEGEGRTCRACKGKKHYAKTCPKFSRDELIDLGFIKKV